MRFLRPRLGFTRRGKQINVGTGNKLNQDNMVDEIRNYQQNWLQYLNGMENNHLPKLALHCQPHGKRDIECARRRWIQHDHLKASELHRIGLEP